MVFCKMANILFRPEGVLLIINRIVSIWAWDQTEINFNLVKN